MKPLRESHYVSEDTNGHFDVAKYHTGEGPDFVKKKLELLACSSCMTAWVDGWVTGQTAGWLHGADAVKRDPPDVAVGCTRAVVAVLGIICTIWIWLGA